MLTAARIIASSLFKAPAQTLSRQPSISLLTKRIGCFYAKSDHRIFEMIERETNEENLNKVYIEMASVSNQIRHDAIKILLERIIDGEFSPEAITNEKFNVHLKKHPELLFHAYFFRIGNGLNRLVQYIEQNQDKGKKQTVKDINDAFAVCFDALKKMEGDEAPIREIELYKSFAHYHCTFLKSIVDQSKVKLCLTKGRDFYKGALTKIIMHAKIFLQRRKKLLEEAQLNKVEIPKSQNQESISSINQKLFELFEYFSEALIEMIDIESQIHDMQNPVPEAQAQAGKDQKDSASSEEKGSEQLVEEDDQGEWRYEYPKAVVAMDSVIEKGLNNYALVKDKVYKSQFYCKLKKILQQIRYEGKIRKIEQSDLSNDQASLKKQEANRQLVSRMNAIFKDGIESYRQLCNDYEEPQQLQEQALILVEIKMHYFQLSNFAEETLEIELGKEIQNIVDCMPQEKMRKKGLLQIIKYIKQVYDVDISRYVQKIPRSMRVARKTRRSEML